MTYGFLFSSLLHMGHAGISYGVDTAPQVSLPLPYWGTHDMSGIGFSSSSFLGSSRARTRRLSGSSRLCSALVLIIHFLVRAIGHTVEIIQKNSAKGNQKDR